MKMIMTVIHDEDSHKLVEKLFNAGYSSTKLASTGGLLRTGNTTLFIGVEAEQVQGVIAIIKETCQTNKRISLINPPTSAMPEGY
ncbi:MAG: cyclic-di-AMP receptor, partial [Vallitaleaceae bacterium]|nr:cyclic-di-AMP receptor [Vallitaleaceae bacterium]